MNTPRLALFCLLLLCCVSPAFAAKTLKLHHSGLDMPGRDPMGTTARVFKNMVEADSNGELRVTILAGGVLGSDADALKQVKAGHIQSALVDADAVSPLYPPMVVLELPFALPDAPTAASVMDGPFGRQLATDIRRATGLKVLGFGDAGGFVQFTTPQREFIGPAGFNNGKRVGVTSPTHARLVQRLGAEPVILPQAELFPALQDGRIDSVAGLISELAASRVGEAQKYLILGDALLVPTVWTLNADFWDGLSQEEKALVSRAARTALMAGRGVARAGESTDKGLPALKNSMKPLSLSPDARTALRDSALPAFRESAESVPDGAAILNAYLNAIETESAMWRNPDLPPAEALTPAEPVAAPVAPAPQTPATPETTTAPASPTPTPATPAPTTSSTVPASSATSPMQEAPAAVAPAATTSGAQPEAPATPAQP